MPPGGAHAAEAGDERPENTGSGEGQEGGGIGKTGGAGVGGNEQEGARSFLLFLCFCVFVAVSFRKALGLFL